MISHFRAAKIKALSFMQLPGMYCVLNGSPYKWKGIYFSGAANLSTSLAVIF